MEMVIVRVWTEKKTTNYIKWVTYSKKKNEDEISNSFVEGGSA